MTDWTAAHPSEGVVIHQPARGHRYSADVYWLVGFALESRAPGTVLDLGTGSGVIAALFAALGADALGVDAFAPWEPGWARTLEDSRFSGSLRLEQADVRALCFEPVDLVVCNPPFFPAGSGPMPPNPWRAAARSEGEATLADFARAAYRHLDRDAEACFVVPRTRVDELATACPWHIVRRVDVGGRRSLVALRLNPSPHEVGEVASPERIEGWFQAARRLADPPHRS